MRGHHFRALICAWAPFLVPICVPFLLCIITVNSSECPCVLGNSSWCPCVPAHPICLYVSVHPSRCVPICYHSGDRMCPGTFLVSMCSCTHPVPTFAQAPLQCQFLHGHHFGAHMFPGNLLVPICSRATFRCPYDPGHHSGVDMCQGTIPVPICARAPS